MKSIIRNNRVLVFVFFTLFGVNTASAVANSTSPGPETVQLKYIGLIKNQPVFELHYAGKTETDRSTIIVKDKDGNILYNEQIIGKTFSKKFLVNTDEIGTDDLQFELATKGTGIISCFNVNASRKLVEQSVFVKL